jgi:hypothetical protein
VREEGSILWIMFLLDGMPFKLEYLKRVLDRLRRSECDFEKRRSSQVDYGIASVLRQSIDTEARDGRGRQR